MNISPLILSDLYKDFFSALKKSPDFFRRKSKLFPQKVRTFLRKCLNFFHRYFSPPQTQVISPLKQNDNQTHERFLTISDLDLKQNPYIWQHFTTYQEVVTTQWYSRRLTLFRIHEIANPKRTPLQDNNEADGLSK